MLQFNAVFIYTRSFGIDSPHKLWNFRLPLLLLGSFPVDCLNRTKKSLHKGWLFSQKTEKWARRRKTLVNFNALASSRCARKRWLFPCSPRVKPNERRRRKIPSMSWKNYEKRFILLLNAFNALQYRKSPPFLAKEPWWWFLWSFFEWEKETMKHCLSKRVAPHLFPLTSPNL